MITGYHARKFGLGLGSLFTNYILNAVNERRKGTDYISEEDATLVNTNAKKKELTSDTTMKYLVLVYSMMVIGMVTMQSCN